MYFTSFAQKIIQDLLTVDKNDFKNDFHQRNLLRKPPGVIACSCAKTKTEMKTKTKALVRSGTNA